MAENTNHVIWIEIESPNMLGSLELDLGSDHFIQFNMGPEYETNESIKLESSLEGEMSEEMKFVKLQKDMAVIEKIKARFRSEEQKNQLRTMKRNFYKLQDKFPHLKIPKKKPKTPAQRQAERRAKLDDTEKEARKGGDRKRAAHAFKAYKEYSDSEGEEMEFKFDPDSIKEEPGDLDEETEEDDVKPNIDSIKSDPDEEEEEDKKVLASDENDDGASSDGEDDNDDDDGASSDGENQGEVGFSENLLQVQLEEGQEMKIEASVLPPPVEGAVSEGGPARKKDTRDHSKKDPSLKCERCRKTFCLYKSFQRHKRLNQCIEKGDDYVRPSLRPCLCPHCGTQFTHRSSLRSHIKTVHLKEKNYRCDQCDQCYVDRTNLLRHIETKHLEETYYCEFCPRTFTATVYLREHVKRQHSDTTVACPNCNKNFIQQKNLDLHLLNGICDEANIEYKKEKKRLKEKTFQCPHCPLAMSTGSRLKRHVTTVHIKGTGMSPKGKSHRCSHCEFHTPFKKRLMTHMEQMHPKLYNPYEQNPYQPKSYQPKSYEPTSYESKSFEPESYEPKSYEPKSYEEDPYEHHQQSEYA